MSTTPNTSAAASSAADAVTAASTDATIQASDVAATAAAAPPKPIDPKTQQYEYTKERRTFGAPTNFSDRHELQFSQAADRRLFQTGYILQDPVDQATQYGVQMAVHEVNTERAHFESRGCLHTEGGWPKDISLADPEQTTRYRRKIEKDELFIGQVMRLCQPMEHCILQNNAVNIYETFFEDLEPAPLLEPCSSRTLNVYRDPCARRRPVTHLSWSPDGGGKLAVSYCDKRFADAGGEESGTDSFVWEVENPNAPLLTLRPPSANICLEYNQKDPTSLISGTLSGQVAAWDTRVHRDPVAISEREHCHRAAVNSVSWINSKSGTEFFSGSADGQVIWWDTRRLAEPLERLYMDPERTDEQELGRSFGVSVLEYETTMPTKFMCGTDMGALFVCNRKGKTPSEKIAVRMPCQLGPVLAVVRNPQFLKNFLTVGDWTARVWSEDCRESAIVWTRPQPAQLTDGVWSAAKCSMFYTSRADGVLDAWDLLQQHGEPVLSIKVCDEPLLCMRAHEAGRWLGAGSKNGATHLIEVSEYMAVGGRNDKPLLTAMFERENRREKILEAKLREAKLKVRTLALAHEESDETRAARAAALEVACAQAEREFVAAVEAEKAKMFPMLFKHRSAAAAGEEEDGVDNGTEDAEAQCDDEEAESLVSE